MGLVGTTTSIRTRTTDKRWDQHICWIRLDPQVMAPVIISTIEFSVIAPVPDCVNAPTGPKTLSLGGR